MGRPKGSKNGVRRIVEKVCETCSTTFRVEPYRVSARFCSRACQAKGHSKELFRQQERHCRQCGTVFMARPAAQKIYCSQQCASRAHGVKVRGTRSTTVIDSSTCPICGADFAVRKSLHQKYCSRPCANKSYERRITLTCQVCQKRFDTRAKHQDQKYCSRTCRTIGIGKTESHIEKLFANALATAGIIAVQQVAVWHYTLDFAIPDQMIAIECDGDYWHSLPECVRRDRRKDRFLLSRGWRVLRFSETALNSNLNKCIEIVKQALAS
jgi:very-short-patch-repair endonuclease